MELFLCAGMVMHRICGIKRCHGWQGAVMHRVCGIKRCHGWQGAVRSIYSIQLKGYSTTYNSR